MSDIEDTIEKIGSSVKGNVKSKHTNIKHPENLGQYEKTKHKKNKNSCQIYLSICYILNVK